MWLVVSRSAGAGGGGGGGWVKIKKTWGPHQATGVVGFSAVIKDEPMISGALKAKYPPSTPPLECLV